MEIHTCQVLRSEIREKRAVASFQLFLGGSNFFWKPENSRGVVGEVLTIRGGVVGEVLTIRGGGSRLGDSKYRIIHYLWRPKNLKKKNFLILFIKILYFHLFIYYFQINVRIREICICCRKTVRRHSNPWVSRAIRESWQVWKYNEI